MNLKENNCLYAIGKKNCCISLEQTKSRLISIFEYENDNAYKACQKIIEEKVMPKGQASYTIIARNNRGVIFNDYRS